MKENRESKNRPYINRHLTLTRVTLQYYGEKMDFSINNALITSLSIWWMKVNLIPTTYHTENSIPKGSCTKM